MRLLLGLAAFVVLVAGALAGAWLCLATPSTFLATRPELLITAFLLSAGLSTVGLSFTRSVGLRIGLLAAMLAVGDALLVAHLLDAWPFPVDPFHDQRYVAFLVVMLTACIYGLVRQRLWGRWLGLAFGTLGALSAGLNAGGYILAERRDDWAWIFILFTVGALLVAINLADRDLTDSVLSRSRQSPLWRSTDPLVRVTRLALLANLGTISMLLVYAWLQPFVPATASPALGLAGFLAVGTVLVMLRKSVGGLVLGIGGVALLALTYFTWLGGRSRPDLVAYYAVFWVPAALLGIACGALVVWRAATRGAGPTIVD